MGDLAFLIPEFFDLDARLNPFSAKPIFSKKKKSFLRNFIATLVFMPEREILSFFFFFFFFF